jgi:hypothetical protein
MGPKFYNRVTIFFDPYITNYKMASENYDPKLLLKIIFGNYL